MTTTSAVLLGFSLGLITGVLLLALALLGAQADRQDSDLWDDGPGLEPAAVAGTIRQDPSLHYAQTLAEMRAQFEAEQAEALAHHGAGTMFDERD